MNIYLRYIHLLLYLFLLPFTSWGSVSLRFIMYTYKGKVYYLILSSDEIHKTTSVSRSEPVLSRKSSEDSLRLYTVSGILKISEVIKERGVALCLSKIHKGRVQNLSPYRKSSGPMKLPLTKIYGYRPVLHKSNNDPETTNIRERRLSRSSTYTHKIGYANVYL